MKIFCNKILPNIKCIFFLFQEEEVDEEEVYEEGEEDAGEGMDEEGEGNA